MNFFQAQDNARRKSGRLVFFYIAAVVAIIVTIYCVLVFGLRFASQNSDDPEMFAAPLWQPDMFLGTAVVTIAIIGFGSLFKTLSLRSGGGVVARSAGGRLVPPNTGDPQCRRLVNIVEEMAIASGVRMPEVYVLPEAGINAFAAGYSPDDAAVAVTQGALDALTRDELQGVVAHEFSHILNGDMRLNIRLIGLLFGILLITLVGRVVMRLGFSSDGRRSSSKDKGGSAIAFALLGLAIIIIGYVGVFFGRLIQAAVSRQREFLADASAVQFTRNPGGIAGALKKIGAAASGSRIENPHATETSHMYFANALRSSFGGLLATHPPLIDRIKAIDPTFDGNFRAIKRTAPGAGAGVSDLRAGLQTQSQTRSQAHSQMQSRSQTQTPSWASTPASRVPGTPLASRVSPTPHVSPAPRVPGVPPPLPAAVTAPAFLAALSALETPDSQKGADILAAIPGDFRNAAHDPERARAVLLSLLYAKGDAAVSAKQDAIVARALGTTERVVFIDMVARIETAPSWTRIALGDMALASIRRLDARLIDGTLEAVDALIDADGEVSLHEYALRKVIHRNLRPPGRPGILVKTCAPLAGDIALVLGAVASAGASSEAARRHAFEAGATAIRETEPGLALTMPEQQSGLNANALIRALNRLDLGAPVVKQAVITALVRAISDDGKIEVAEQDLLRAVAAALNCPAPVGKGLKD
ncbi:MAG: M48 family metalloprotease [Opitutaceae bacterium]|jgi:Zn-dependent protease with chaperone function|nr:M48 family metalloprotease [Opitutaceae bacterium]